MSKKRYADAIIESELKKTILEYSKGKNSYSIARELKMEQPPKWFECFQKDFNEFKNTQLAFNERLETKVDSLETKVDSLETKVDANTVMIKKAHPELFSY